MIFDLHWIPARMPHQTISLSKLQPLLCRPIRSDVIEDSIHIFANGYSFTLGLLPYAGQKFTGSTEKESRANHVIPEPPCRRGGTRPKASRDIWDDYVGRSRSLNPSRGNCAVPCVRPGHSPSSAWNPSSPLKSLTGQAIQQDLPRWRLAVKTSVWH